MRILLAEDDKNLGIVMKSELEDEECHIDLVHDGVEAVLLCLDNPYNFVLLDIVMPHLDGINAIRIIKRLNPNIPVLAFSGNAGSHQMEASCRAGAIACLTKPFPMSELKDYLKKCHRARLN